jgi:predicted metal-dependent hydrolase
MNTTSTKRFTAEQIVARASQLHIMLGLEGDDLRVIAPKGAMNEKIRTVLNEYKPQLVAYLKEQEQAYLKQHDITPLCATCLDIDRENTTPALPEPYNDLYYCEQHHPTLEEGANTRA